MTTVPPPATPTLDDVVARLKADVPALIQAAQGTGTTPAPGDAAVVELTTLADQVDAALAALKGPGTGTTTLPTGTPTDPGAPAAPAAPAT